MYHHSFGGGTLTEWYPGVRVKPPSSQQGELFPRTSTPELLIKFLLLRIFDGILLRTLRSSREHSYRLTRLNGSGRPPLSFRHQTTRFSPSSSVGRSGVLQRPQTLRKTKDTGEEKGRYRPDEGGRSLPVTQVSVTGPVPRPWRTAYKNRLPRLNRGLEKSLVGSGRCRVR